MAVKDVSVVLAHGAWADGSSWVRVITALKVEGASVSAAPLPLTSLADDVAALNRSLDRTELSRTSRSLGTVEVPLGAVIEDHAFDLRPPGGLPVRPTP
jgi:hypothetical protein